MSDKIKAEDLFDGDPFGGINSGLETYVKNLKDANDGIKDMIKSGRDLVNVLKFDNSAAVDKLDKSIRELNVLIAQSTKLTSAQVTAEKKLTEAQIAQEKLAQQKIKTQREQEKNNQQAAKTAATFAKEQAKAAKATEQSASAYFKLSKQLNENKKMVKDLLASGKELSESDKNLIKRTQELDAKLKEIDKTVGDTNREVGNYKGAIKDAFNESGLFSTGIGRLVVGLGHLKERFEENSKSSNKFSANLKLGLAGGITLAVVALKELAEINQTVKDGFENFVASLKDLVSSGNEYQKLNELTRAFKYEVIQLNEELQKATLNQEDFNEISNDTTIGYKERNAALKESIALGQKRAEISVTIAQKELDIANQAIAAEKSNTFTGKTSIELLQKRGEAQEKLNAAIDAQNDLTRQNAAIERQRRVDEAVDAVELLRSKKLAYDQQANQLEAQLKNEKLQSEERRIVAQKLLSVQNQTTAEEIALFKKKTGIQFEENKLLEQSDRVKLANQLRSITQINEEGKAVGIGEAAISELAKIVKEYQENRINNGKAIAEIDKEEIANTQKISILKKEISGIQNQLLIDIQAADIDQAKAFAQKNPTIKNFERVKELIADETKLKKQALVDQSVIDQENARNNIDDKEVEAEEIKKIKEKLVADLARLDLGYIKSVEDVDNEALEARKKRAKEMADTIINAIESVLKRENELTEAALDRNIEMRKSNIQQQQSLAERGLDNQLAFEQAQLAKAELAKAELAKKEQRQKEALALMKLIADDGFVKGSIEFALAKAIAGSFKDGVEDLEGPGTETSDSILARLSKGESVATASATRENPGLVTAMNKGKVDEYFKNELLPGYMTETGINTGSFARNVANSAMIHELVSVKEEIKGLKQVIQARPVHQSEITKAGDVIETKIANGLRTVILHKTAKKPL